MGGAVKSVTGNDYVHQQVVVVNLKDLSVVAAFNGNPYDKMTGQKMDASTSGRDALRADVGEIPQMPLTIIGTKPLFVGSKAEVMELAARGVIAANQINQKAPDYNLLRVNSNSVANTIVRSMGLELPAQDKGVQAPGSQHCLLSDAEMKQIAKDVSVHGVDSHEAVVRQAKSDMSVDSVSRGVRSEFVAAHPNPKSGMGDNVRMGVISTPPTQAVPDWAEAYVKAYAEKSAAAKADGGAAPQDASLQRDAAEPVRVMHSPAAPLKGP